MKTALLVIDVQRALCTGPYAVFDASGLIQRINALADKARSAAVPVIFIQHESSDGVLDHGTDGWQLAEGLNALPTDVYLRKTASDSFHQTELCALLKGPEVQRLVICGLQSEFCVDTTIRRALALGYPVTLASDGHSTLDNEVLSATQIVKHHNLTLANLTSFGPCVTPVPSAEIRFAA